MSQNPEGLALEKPENKSKKGLIVVPGISTGPYGTPFDEVVEFAKQENYTIVRINTWNKPEDLEQKTLQDLHQNITQATRLLREQCKCESIGILGKSFGGQLTLTHPNTNEMFDQVILWAPALSIDEEGNLCHYNYFLGITGF